MRMGFHDRKIAGEYGPAIGDEVGWRIRASVSAIHRHAATELPTMRVSLYHDIMRCCVACLDAINTKIAFCLLFSAAWKRKPAAEGSENRRMP